MNDEIGSMLQVCCLERMKSWLKLNWDYFGVFAICRSYLKSQNCLESSSRERPLWGYNRWTWNELGFYVCDLERTSYLQLFGCEIDFWVHTSSRSSPTFVWFISKSMTGFICYLRTKEGKANMWVGLAKVSLLVRIVMLDFAFVSMALECTWNELKFGW